MVFMKNGLLLNGYRIKELIGDVEGKFLFFYESSSIPINQANEAFYLIDMERTLDADRILDSKDYIEGKKSAYIFE